MFLKFSLFLVISSGILKFFAIFYTDFNLFGDEAQYWVWSQNLNLGYYSKPPLLAWLISFVVFMIVTLFNGTFSNDTSHELSEYDLYN